MAVKKGNNVSVTAQECRGNHERMIKRFIKKTKKERIIEEAKDRQYYKKPSQVRREKNIRRKRELAKLERKKK